jgi:hypothetical protein
MTKNNNTFYILITFIFCRRTSVKKRSLYGTFVELSEFRCLMDVFQNPPLCVTIPTGRIVYVRTVHRKKR